MKANCPKIDCKKPENIIEYGWYFRKNDSRFIKRFFCKSCNSSFSKATNTLEYGQNKRRINYKVKQLLASGMSIRRIAILLKVNKTTVARKASYLAKKARLSQEKFLLSLRKLPVSFMQIDDLITIEHTKCKPLSVTVAVDGVTRKILGAQVSSMPAFGHLAKIAKRKYGYRKDDRDLGIKKLFSKIEKSVFKWIHIESDEHTLYPKNIRRFFPLATHDAYKSERGCIAGQGELKKVLYDPLFKINHTLAMLRANVNRLFRRTWCTTKLPDKLQDHIDIYIDFHNKELV